MWGGGPRLFMKRPRANAADATVRFPGRSGGLVVVVAIACASCAAPLHRVSPRAPTTADAPADHPAPKVSGRPMVGVALGGGSARGIAHVGVIRWLEEHRIPIDVAAGTSMGGLVGGALSVDSAPGRGTTVTCKNVDPRTRVNDSAARR